MKKRYFVLKIAKDQKIELLISGENKDFYTEVLEALDGANFEFESKWISLDECKRESLGFSLLIINQDRSEDIDMLMSIQTWREETSFTTPILLVTKEVSPDLEEYLSEIELLWTTYTPIVASEFQFRIQKLIELIKLKRVQLNSRFEAGKAIECNDIKKALKNIDRAKGGYPSFNQLCILESKLFIQQGKYKEAKSTLIPLMGSEQKFMSLEALLESALESSSYFHAVSMRFNRIELMNYLYWAKKHLNSGNFEQAAEAYVQVLQRSPANKEESEANLGLNVCELAGVKVEDYRIPGADPTTIARFINNDIYLYVDNDVDPIVASFYEKLLHAEEEILIKMYFNMGIACKMKGKLDRALTYLAKCKTSSDNVSQKIVSNIKQIRDLMESTSGDETKANTNNRASG